MRINNCLKSNSTITVATVKITGDFHCEKKPSTKLTVFAVRKNEGETKENTGIHEEYIVHSKVFQEAPLRPKQCNIKNSSLCP